MRSSHTNDWVILRVPTTIPALSRRGIRRKVGRSGFPADAPRPPRDHPFPAALRRAMGGSTAWETSLPTQRCRAPKHPRGALTRPTANHLRSPVALVPAANHPGRFAIAGTGITFAEMLAGVSSDGGLFWLYSRRKAPGQTPGRNPVSPAGLFNGTKVSIVLRQSEPSDVFKDRISTCLLRVPLFGFST